MMAIRRLIGEAEAGVPNRVEEEAVAAGELGQEVVRHLAQAVERLGVHPNQVQRHVPPRAEKDVGAQPAPAPPQVVHHHQAPRQLARVAGVLGDHDAVLDHPRRRPAAVPHELVERRDVDEQHVRVVDHVRRVRRVLAGRVVLQVDARQPPLRVAEELVLVDQVVLAGLEEDAVQARVPHLVRGHLVDGGRPRVAPWRQAHVAGGQAGLHRHVQLQARLGQVVQVPAVDMPGEDAQGTQRSVSLAFDQRWRYRRPATGALPSGICPKPAAVERRGHWAVAQTRCVRHRRAPGMAIARRRVCRPSAPRSCPRP
jgi:hypothetical protein